MIQGDRETERKVVTILKVLSESSEPIGSTAIARELESHGIYLSERTIRYHLRILDERGLTRLKGRDGRSITQEGLEELKSALAPEQIGFIIERLNLLAYQTKFDPQTRTGHVPVNASLFPMDRFREALEAMKEVFAAGLCVSDMVATAQPGEKLGDVVIPEGRVGLATICSAVINGVLLKAGVPMDSKFGGILEIRNREPRRFVAIINYAGTSLDPSEAYIRARMTSVLRAATTGTGRVLANFREIPAPSRPLVEGIVADLKMAGIGGVLLIGEASEPLCQIPVGLNKIGMVLLGGLNPLAAAEEAGVEAENIAEAGTIDFHQFVSCQEL
jgi:hypothetical protein